MTKGFLRTIPHLRIRTDFQSLLLRTRSVLVSNIQSYFSETHRSDLPVYLVHPPLITSSDCEGAGEVFTLNPKNRKLVPPSSTESGEKEELYFRDAKYLTVSSQLHLEAFCAELGAVYAFAPTFRAEESDTPRHLAEFYMLEAEYRTMNLQQIMAGVKTLIKRATAHIMNHRTGEELVQYYADRKHGALTEEVTDLQQRWTKLLGPWLTLDYTAAMLLLQEAHDAKGGKLFTHRPVWEQGLHLEHERWLTDVFVNNQPVFVTDYPKVVKPFYMLPSKLGSGDDNAERPSDSRETVACFDLLLPFGYCEVAGGSLREHRLPDLIANMREKGLLNKVESGTTEPYPFLQSDESLGSLKWYADLRRFGSSPHGGYGLGFDRLLAYLTGVANVRDVVAFPRVWGKADC
jgi:asparaginyl-tRNA synthetase